MANERIYTSRRQEITKAIAEKLKEIDGTGEYLSNVYTNVEARLLFWDEINEFPAIHLNAGSEIRKYQGGGYKDRYLTITIRCYVKSENAVETLADLLEDVETVLEVNAQLEYYDRRGACQKVHQITILSIDTDEGVLEPLGVGEVLIQVQY
jgi:hypothetical protein